jgi:peptidoglycan/xylan/chitin deacetylase (PgdA/CDA1 family)
MYLNANGVSTRIFWKQIQFLANHWAVQPAEKINDVDAKGVFLTFDDGMRNNYTIVLPILEKYGLTGLFPVCPGPTAGKIPYIWHHHIYLILRPEIDRAIRLPLNGYQERVAVAPSNVDQLEKTFFGGLTQNGVASVYDVIQEICSRNNRQYARNDYLPDMFHPMTWGMIADLSARGHVIASHTWSHRILRLLPAHKKMWEFKRSKKVLEGYLGRQVENIVYPYGTDQTVDEESLILARRAGYRQGFLNVAYHRL